jgi:hypothetical protein
MTALRYFVLMGRFLQVAFLAFVFAFMLTGGVAALRTNANDEAPDGSWEVPASVHVSEHAVMFTMQPAMDLICECALGEGSFACRCRRVT